MEDAIIIQVDTDLEDLIPGFLQNRRNDLQLMQAASAAGDFAELRRLGHIMKGVGSGYGFTRITELGAEIEQAAASQEAAAIALLASQLENYLNRLTIVYEEQP